MSGTLILTVGLPASGKSTWALEQIRLGKADVRVNRDELRMAMFGTHLLESRQEDLVTKVQHDAVGALLAKGLVVIVDDTNLRKKTRTLFMELAHRSLANYRVEDSFLKVSLDEVLKRNDTRAWGGKRYVPEEIICGMAERYSNLVGIGIPGGEPYRIVNSAHTSNQPLRNLTGERAFIVDIDGTVADHNGRNPYDASAISDDLLYAETADLVKAYAEHRKLLFVSGRDSKYRPETEDWLIRQGFENFNLYMRAEGDRRDDSQVKFEIYRDQILPHFNVNVVFDDRDRVVAMWRRLGLQVMQVNYGAF